MFSVVIPVYNKSKTIIRCLDSVSNQTFSPSEIIIVNDGSSDNSLDLIKYWINHNNNISCKLISHKNQGVANSRNEGVDVSHNNYVALLDADDYWDKDFLFNMKKVIDMYPDIALATCKHEILDAEIGKFMPDQFFGLENIGLTNDYLRLAKKYPIVNSSKIVLNKKYFKKSGGFPKGVIQSEDLFLWIKLSMLAPFGYCNKVLVTVYQEKDNSRISRVGEIPYPIIYFSKEKNEQQLDKHLINFLWSIHLKHILASCTVNKHEAWKRIIAGLSLFKFKGAIIILLMLIPKSIFRYARKKKREYLKSLHEEK